MKSKHKKILFGCLGAIILCTLITLGIILYILSAVFDDAPHPQAVRIPDYENLQSATGKLSSVFGLSSENISANFNLENLNMDSLQILDTGANNIDLDNLENLDLGKLDLGKMLEKIDLGKVMNALSKPGSVTLNKGEVNALIDSAFTVEIADRLRKSNDPSKPRIYDAKFDNGEFTVKMTVDSHIPTPFGSYCNIEVVFIPQVIDHHLQLNLTASKIGSLPLPVSYFENIIASQISLYEQTQDGKDVLSVITSLKIDKKEVVLDYDGQCLSPILIRKSSQLQGLGNSSDISISDIMNLLNSSDEK